MPNDVIIDETVIDAEKKQKKKLALMGLVAALVLASAGGGAWYMLSDQPQDGAPAAGSSSATYIEVPAMTVNLRGADGHARFLKLRFILVAADAKKVERIKDRMPVVLDALQPFLRELRPEDLAGSAAVFRIKEEMMMRATQALGAGVVRDVLIQELIQQ